MGKRKKILEKSGERQRSAVAPGARGKSVCVGVILHVGSLYSIILFLNSLLVLFVFYMEGAFSWTGICVIGICGRISAFYGS
jgi:hypothetical protein